MFLPLNDTEPNRYSFFPIMTFLLIVINCFVFYLEIIAISRFRAENEYWPLFMKYAVTPRVILSAQGGGMISNITAMFLHGSLSHLVGNMFPLWVFGRRVEDACGPWRFLAYYLFAGTWAHILFVLVQSDSRIPGVGASGAIFGLMGAYLLLYPGGRIRTFALVPFPIWPRIRAFWIVAFFVGVQIGPAIETYLKKADYSTNHWAHLGGFFSAVFIFLFLRPEAFARYLSDTSV